VSFPFEKKNFFFLNLKEDMHVVMFPRFERRNYQEDLLSKVTGHRCKTKVESAFM
jgi:hypothetical protein